MGFRFCVKVERDGDLQKSKQPGDSLVKRRFSVNIFSLIIALN